MLLFNLQFELRTELLSPNIISSSLSTEEIIKHAGPGYIEGKNHAKPLISLWESANVMNNLTRSIHAGYKW